MKQKAEKEEKDFFSAGMVWLFSYQVLQHESVFVKIDCFWLLPIRVYITAIIEESLRKKKESVHSASLIG